MPQKRVLVIDDDHAILENLAELFADEGYEVMLARNGAEGLSQARQRRPNIIVLDMMMPVMNGAEFRRAQARDATIADVPVVLLSAVPQRYIIDTAAFIPKPFDVTALLTAVARLASPGS